MRYFKFYCVLKYAKGSIKVQRDMKKFSQTEKIAVITSAVIFTLFVCVSVLSAILFSALSETEDDFNDYRKENEILLSQLQKECNDYQSVVDELNNKLSVAENEKIELQNRITEIESEMKRLEDNLDIYQSLNEEISALKLQLEEKNSEIEVLKKNLSALNKMYNVDLNKQFKIVSELETLLSEGAPMNEVETTKYNEDGTPVLDANGKPVVEISYVYPKISVYYEDIENGYKYDWNGKIVYSSASCVKAPFALTVLKAAADEKADYDKMVSDLVIQYGDKAEIPKFEPKYDFDKIFTYTEDKYRPGSGVIKSEKYGVQYSYKELIQKLLKYSDNVAFAELKNEYGVDMLKTFAKEIGTTAMKSNIYNATAIDLGKSMKEIHSFFEKDAYYAPFMKQTMMESIHTVMIGSGVSPKKIAHKYGWDDGAYHDMAIVYDEHPYVLVIMSNMDDGGSEVNSYIQKIVSLIDELHENFYK